MISWSGVGIRTENTMGTIFTIARGFVVFFWVIGVIWTAKDSYIRAYSPMRQFLSIVLVTILGPCIGVPLYLALRPVRHHQGGAGDVQISGIACLYCNQKNSPQYPYCVFCGEKVHMQCRSCQVPYPILYAYCPDCGAPNIDKTK